MKKYILGLIATLAIVSMSFGQSNTKLKELTANDIQFAPVSKSNSKLITIHVQLGRVSKDCKGFGFCGGTVDINFKNNNDSVFAEGLIIENKIGKYLRIDVANNIDKSVYDTDLVIDKDINVEKYIIKSGTYGLDFSSSKYGSYFIKIN